MAYNRENLFEDVADNIMRDCADKALSDNATRIFIIERLRRLCKMIETEDI